MICQALTILLNALEMMTVSFFRNSIMDSGRDWLACKRLGVQLDKISRCHGSEIDKALGIPGQNFAAGGLLVDLLDRLPNLPDPQTGFEFVAFGGLGHYQK